MTNSKTTKKALLSSALALTMCVAMLIATTFAWFTDTASTSVNKIQAGKLDVELVKADQVNNEWVDLGEHLYWTQMSKEGETATAVKEDGKPLWEPGATYNLESFRIKNNGDLGLKYKIAISGLTGNAKLLEAIDFTVSVDENLVAKDGTTSTVDTLGKLNNFEGKLDANAVTGKITITGKMKTEAGNEYQGLSIDNIAITVYATQAEGEYDSKTNDYDKNALYDIKINETATGNLPVSVSDADDKPVTVAAKTEISSGQVSVTYCSGVKLTTAASAVSTSTDGNEKKASVEQELKYKGSVASDETKIKINAETQTAAQYELTLPVAQDNEVLVPVKIDYEKNLRNVEVYHSGVALGTSENDKNGNGEYFTYDSNTGTLILYLKHASKIDVVFDIPGVTSVATAGELETALKDSEVRIVKLTSDMTLSEMITLTDSKTTTIDMNGKTLTCEAKWGAFDLQGASLKIIGKGKIIAKVEKNENNVYVSGAERAFNISNKNSTLTINDVTVETNNGFVAVEEGTLIINSGTYTITNGGSAVFAYGADSKVVINDGTFTGNEKSEGAVYAFNGANVEVKGGQFKFKDEDNVNWTLCDYSQMTTYPFTYGGVKVETAGHISVTGGTFNKDISNLPNYKYDSGFSVVNINYVKSGYAATENAADKTWTVAKSE